uniref:Uncharacterized protein n=1 Tax=Brassica oleracea var. oleracea TaxID=109376 RepID=A0A0D3CJE7_BRAOL
MEPIEERMYMSKASHLAVPKHQRSPIWTEEADGFHKRVKRIHDPVKIVVPCAVFEAESPIPPDRSMQFSSYIEGPAEPVSINSDRIPSIDTNKPASIDTTTSPSIDTTASPSIDSTTSSSIDTGRVLEHKEFDVRGNLKDGDTTTRSDKSGERRRGIGRREKRSRAKGKDLRKTSLHEDLRCPRNIDRQSITSIDRSPLKCVDRQSFKSIDHPLTVLVGTHIKVSTSTNETSSISIDSTSSTSIDCHFIVSIDTEQVIVLTC